MSLFVLVMYMEVVLETITMSDRIKGFLDDPYWHEYINDPRLKQIKRRTSSVLTDLIILGLLHS